MKIIMLVFGTILGINLAFVVVCGFELNRIKHSIEDINVVLDNECKLLNQFDFADTDTLFINRK